MNWITNFVRPKLGAMLNRRETPDNLWRSCDGCGEMIFHRDLANELFVCPSCRHHMHIPPEERLTALFDGGAFEIVETPEPTADPLRFRDQKRYVDRMRDAKAQTGAQDAMLVGYGAIGETPAVAAVQNFAFMAGSMGMAVGESILAAAEAAVKYRAPLIIFAAAGGARMQEGILSLMQMPRTTVAVQMVQEAGLPFISVLTHPTTGGVTASYAMLGDVQIAEPGALICFAGPRVIEQTIREKLPEGFQRAEYLLDHGMLDMVADRRDQRKTIARTLRLLTGAGPLIAGHLEHHVEEPAKTRPEL